MDAALRELGGRPNGAPQIQRVLSTFDEVVLCRCAGGLVGALDLRTLALTTLNRSSEAGFVDLSRRMHFFPDPDSGSLFCQKIGRDSPASPEIRLVRASLRALSEMSYSGLYVRGEGVRAAARAASEVGLGAQERATGAVMRVLERVRLFKRPEVALGHAGRGLRGCLGR